MKTTQINIEVPEELAKRLKILAVSKKVTLRSLAAIAFEKFLDLRGEDRQVAVSHASKKLVGRKVQSPTG